MRTSRQIRSHFSSLPKCNVLSINFSRSINTKAMTNDVIHVKDAKSFAVNLWPHKFEQDVYNLNNEKVGTIELNSEIFKAPIRKDILQRVVTWQLAKQRAGTACAKN